MKEFLIYGAGTLSFLNLTWYAVKVLRKQTPAFSIASWLMWVVLDCVILGSSIATKQPYTLALSYTLGATAVLIAHLKMGTWIWTRVETFSTVGATISVVLWQILDAEWGVIAGITAMNIAGAPLIGVLWKNPDRSAFWMFTNTTIACGMTLLGTWPWTIGGSLLPAAGALFNGTLAWMTLRKKR